MDSLEEPPDSPSTVGEPEPVSVFDHAILCNTPPSELAKKFLASLEYVHWKTLAKDVVEAVEAGLVPPTISHIFFCVCKKRYAIAYTLDQPGSATARRIAITHFKRYYRSRHATKIWGAMGGTDEFFDLINAMSVREVRHFCRCLGQCTKSKSDWGPQAKCITTLYQKLYDTYGEDDKPKIPDARPLGCYYKKMLPGCAPDVVFQALSKHGTMKKSNWLPNSEPYRQNFMAVIFPSEGPGQTITRYKFILDSNNTFFCLNTLKQFSTSPRSLKTNAENLGRDLILPLARRLCNRNEKDDHQIHFYDYVTCCIQKERSIIASLGYEIISCAIKAWNRARAQPEMEAMEKHLETILDFMKNKYQWTLSGIADELQHIKPGLRFSLLRLLARRIRPFKVDIIFSSVIDDLKLKNLGNDWPPKIFLLLPSGISLCLFQRLWDVHRDDMFLERTDEGCTKLGDSDIFSAILQSRHRDSDPSFVNWLPRVTNLIKGRKNMALSALNSENRASLVQYVVFLSIATSSLDLYEEAVVWAKQFHEDTLVMTRLLSGQILFTDEGLDLLSAIPRRVAYGTSLELSRANVVRANQTMLLLVEMAFACLQERSHPFFGVGDVLSLLPKVIQRRAERLEEWQKVVEAERFAINEGFSMPLLRSQQFPSRPRCHISRFLDKLGESRNTFWQEYRAQVHPTMAAIKPPWPKGLPIQDLAPCIPAAWKDMLYLQLRAVEIVLSPGGVLLSHLPTDHETKQAIGSFVDEFRFALRIFICSAQDDSDRQKRIFRAWDHAITELTCSCMSKDEALWYWRYLFCSVPGIRLPEKVVEQFDTPGFRLPAHYDDAGPVKWNPSLIFGHSSLVPTVIEHSEKHSKFCLDYMLKLDGSGAIYTPRYICSDFDPGVEDATSFETGISIWDRRDSLTALRPATREAFIVAIMELLNSKYGQEPSLFAQPFPSADNVRFPALYLDPMFLSKYDKVNLNSVIQALNALSPSIPMKLFRMLIRSMIKRLKAERGNNQEVIEATIATIKALYRSDCPYDAYEFVRQLIFECQIDISWHSHLINAAFLSRLSGKEVRCFLNEFSAAITNRFRRQHRLMISSERKCKPFAPPLVSTRTVGLVAQLLRGARFAGWQLAFTTLLSLYKVAIYPRMQIDILKSLLSIKNNAKSQYLYVGVVYVIRSYVVPYVASVNEINPPHLETWLNDETEKLPLPEVYNGNGRILPPLLKLLTRETRVPSIRHGLSSDQTAWMEDVILPIVEKSTTNHIIWTGLFLKRNRFALTTDDLPHVPVNPALLIHIFEVSPKHLSGDDFRKIRDLAMININPPENIAAVNKAIREDPKLLDSNAGRHWLSIWDLEEGPMYLGLIQSANILLRCADDQSDKILGCIKIADLRHFLLNAAREYISTSDVFGFTQFLNKVLSHKRIIGFKNYQCFVRNCIPLLTDIYKFIGSLRTPEWRNNPNRQPSQLPDAFPLLLEIAHANCMYSIPNQLSTDDALRISLEFSHIILEFMRGDDPNDKHWQTIKQVILRKYDKRHSSYLAQAFCPPKSAYYPNFMAVYYARNELAMEFLSRASTFENVMLVPGIPQMLQVWNNDGDETLQTAARLIAAFGHLSK
ncbi:uncharacterized protein F4822DRAFT_444407 [Hypoxylon trugodes]|uniref:uncharacterized protein n=1 Tax=Hypoxylon trugodes TaxID=326681 RepID=UPI00218F2823|nr:uncharacterized protein F4822DRAFT_444407 [Hypoxylon trugodes]KAI1387878.1 hypothetical protein F4822DRAFT_444407 [Hypoxylon trugodes]